MVDYRRIGKGNMELHLGNAKSTTSLRDLWESPRGTVLRIQALAMVAIIVSFFLAAFGSCRRWSNRWIVQRGFFAAHALSLSLGAYSIGLMQSSSVKSEMYPIWTVSLFTLFGFIDPVTTYNGLDYKGPLSKVAYGICLNCGYVLLMGISSISNVIVKISIVTLSAITFIKGFHRSLALVQQSRMRNLVQNLEDKYGETSVLRIDDLSEDAQDQRHGTVVDFHYGIDGINDNISIYMIIWLLSKKYKDELRHCYDACVALCLSHKLQRHFLGLSDRKPYPENMNGINYTWALKVIEIELAFLYDIFFTGNPFLHYYQAKASSLWALASFIGICFVGVAAAIPGTITSRRPGGSTKFVDTTTADLVITFVILVSLALLQLMHLIRCWTSNWARVAVACAYARNRKKQIGSRKEYDYYVKGQEDRPRWLRLKAFVVTSTNWFDKYLWQDKIGQCSILPDEGMSGRKKGEGRSSRRVCKHIRSTLMVGRLYKQCVRLVKMLGLDYIGEVLWDLLGNDTNKRGAVRLDDDVKASVIEFLGKIKDDRCDGNWLSFPMYPSVKRFLPYYDEDPREGSLAYRYTSCVMTWHIVTWYCQVAEQELEKQHALSKAEKGIGSTEASACYYLRKASAAEGGGGGEKERESEEKNRNRRVANALSKYCAFLVAWAPELLPGPALDTKRAYDEFVEAAKEHLSWPPSLKGKVPIALLHAVCLAECFLGDDPTLLDVTRRSHVWETLALVWVRMLVYGAPYGNVEAHMRRLPQGGEFITHLWALLYHLDIRKWKPPEKNLHNITTIEDAERILAEDDQAAVAFVSSLSCHSNTQLAAAASTMEHHVRFYRILDPYIARHFDINPAAKCPALVLLNKMNDNKLTLYDGEFHADDIARFVSNQLGLAMQSSEDGGQSEDDIIEEEISSLS